MTPKATSGRAGGQAQRASGPARWPTRLVQDHVRALSGTLRRLRRRWPGTLLTLFVLGITLALPSGLQVFRSNLGDTGQRLGRQSLQTTLFLKDSVSKADGRALAKKIGTLPGVTESRYISKAEALREFDQHGGGASGLLDHNPLPASIVVAPDPNRSEADTRALVTRLAAMPDVGHVQFDRKWLQQLYALVAVVQRVMLMVIGVLTISVVIVIGNTVRLDIENRRDEIEVLKLVGATDGYVRRPFLYAGLCYGFGGAVLAAMLVDIAVWSLQGPVRHLAGLYGRSGGLQGLDFRTLLALLGSGLALGWLGAFWSVSRHLKRINPG